MLALSYLILSTHVIVASTEVNVECLNFPDRYCASLSSPSRPRAENSLPAVEMSRGLRPARRGLALLLLVLLVVDLASIANAALAAISIDLGSQYIKVGLVKPGVPMEIVLNKESQRKTPFAVGIRNGERFFSDSAAQLGIKQPSHTFTSFMDLVGKEFDNPLVKQYQQRNPHLKLVKDEKRGTVIFDTPEGKFSVESLLAMILWNAKEQSQAYAEQSIRDAVITIPAYFNQAERKAVAAAAEIAGLNLLQLLSSGSAAGLNYGVFRRKEIKEQAQTLLIYDVGASSTIATVVEYRLVKDKQSKEQYPVMSTLGVGYDRQLGGRELTFRLREHLISEFKQKHPSGGAIEDNARAMAKLMKEAERVKQVLSANTDHFAQIESVFEDRDLKVKVTRDHLHEMLKPLEAHYLQPVIDALKMAEMGVDKVDLVALMGAGTRIPRLQELLQEYVGKGKELGRFLNTDEAIALGGVYQAAHLSKGFKVLRFDVQELQIYPIQATFPAASSNNKSAEQTEVELKLVNRPIYGYKSHYPAAKKLISFTSHRDDFSLNLNYGSLDHLSKEQLEQFGSTNISEVAVRDVKSTLEAETLDEDTTFKGIKVHFELDPYGVVRVDQAELIVERMEKPTNSTISSIMGKIGEFFSGPGVNEEEEGKIAEDLFKDMPPLFDSNEDAKTTDTLKSDEKTEAKGGKGKEKQTGSKSSKEKKSEEKADKAEGAKGGEKEKSFDTKPEKESGEDKEKESKKKGAGSEGDKAKTDDSKPASDGEAKKEAEAEKKPPKPKIVKAPLKLVVDSAFHDLAQEDIEVTKKILADFEKKEKEKTERDAALNSLESALYDLSSKLDEDDFTRFGTLEELEAIRSIVTSQRSWLEDEVGVETTTSEIKEKKKELDSSAKKLKYRRRQSEERVRHVEKLESVLNESSNYVETFKNLSDVITEVETGTLDKVVKETTEWWTAKKEEQEKLLPNHDPAFTTSELKDKVNAVDREIKYLLNKMISAKMKAEAEAKKLKEAEEKKKEGEAKEKKKEGEAKEKKKEGAEKEPDTEQSTGEEFVAEPVSEELEKSAEAEEAAGAQPKGQSQPEMEEVVEEKKVEANKPTAHDGDEL